MFLKSFTLGIAASLFLSFRAGAEPPDDFPRFIVPGHETEMSQLRDLYWLHYPGAGPKSTLWDEWLTDPSLWPAVTNAGQLASMRQQWHDVLSGRIIDADGYVATHQHHSIAHQLGWPFPFWNQGRHGCGWHFSFKDTVGEGWRPHDLSKPTGWSLTNASDRGVTDEGWSVEVTNQNAILTAPVWNADTFEVPFMQVRWKASPGAVLNPYIEWATAAAPFDSSRRMYFEPPKGQGISYTMVPLYRHPQWTGEIRQVRIGLGNSATGQVALQAVFSQYDTRHNINAQDFIRGCAKYFWWSGDVPFVRENIDRMRLALRSFMREHHTEEENVVFTTWIGHDGRTGLKQSADGKKEIITGQGIGNNYWDLLPFGGKDAYATIQYYDALNVMAEIEAEAIKHPEWQLPRTFLAFEPEFLRKHAARVKAQANRVFWNEDAGRFVGCVDSAGERHDYGFTFLNCEAIYYDLASPEHAASIMAWLDGARKVSGDTSQGEDIYHWRFAARSTTRRNLDWYFWAWSNPESIPWGGQVQDGGAVLAFSYHDLMARLKVLGPDNAWRRLREIARWYGEVERAGGYRKYYDGSREGTLQGAGTPGGLGLDKEFFESAMVPQIMLKGFLGFAARGDGFVVNPNLPNDWPELSVTQIQYQRLTMQVTASRTNLEIAAQGHLDHPLAIFLPAGKWRETSAGLKHSAQKGPGLEGFVIPSGEGFHLVLGATK